MTETVKLSSPSLISESNDSESNDFGCVDVDTLKEDIEECLTNIDSVGSFSLFEPLLNAPNPGLFLKGTGTIGLPLSDRDAQAIVAASHEAPFGKGEQTIIDDKIRKTWELSPGEFELKNPSWQPFLKSIVEKVSSGLGVDANGKGVTAQLYKLLLYGEGAFFKAHQDSEKAPRMFGTLVIALPSKHDGGEVRVKHAGQTKVLETSKFSEFDSSYLAWFADVTHEVKPVLSGHRLVLTYNLIHTTLGSKELGAKSDKTTAKLRSIFSWWNTNIESDLSIPTSLAFLLEHEYTSTSLCYDSLKGHDQQVASHLREVCSDNGFSFYLASLVRTVQGSCEDDYGYGYGYRSGGFHEIIDEFDSDISLKKVVKLDGSEIAQDVAIDESYFIQSTPFEKLKPDDEEFSGYTGNEGVSATHFYRRTVAILVPKGYRAGFLLTTTASKYDSTHQSYDNSKVSDLLDRLSDAESRDSGNSVAREDLEQICRIIIRFMKNWKARPPPALSWRSTNPAPFSDEIMTRIVTTAMYLDSRELFVEAYELSAGNFTLPMSRSVGTGLIRYGLESMLPKLSSQLAVMNSFASRYAVIQEVRAGMKVESRISSGNHTLFQNWFKSELERALTTMIMVSEKDGRILGALARKFPSQAVPDNILHAVKRNANHTPMTMAFLTTLLEARNHGDIPENVAQAIFKDLLSDLAPLFSMQCLGQESQSKRVRIGLSDVTPAILIPDQRNSNNLMVIFYECLSFGFESELDQLVEQVLVDATKVPITVFEILYIPFLKLLIDKLQGKKDSMQNTRVQRLYHMILGIYVVRYVQSEPKPPLNWTLPFVHCNCIDCADLNAFLGNPTQRIGRFSVAKARRQHLHQKLDEILTNQVTHETERTGSPQTLIVTKTQAKYHAEHKAWKQRRVVAKSHLNSLEQSSLQVLLGIRYRATMDLSVEQLLRPVKPSAAQNSFSALGQCGDAANRVLPPISKRKVPNGEVIVIDD